ncbi:MAG: serine/threonine-protein kinase [Polyangiaceae bacterium]
MSFLSPGTVFANRYEVVRRLSQGGMGAVYEVVHIETRRRRALKVMLPELAIDADMRARFKREAIITADIRSKNIVETFDAGVDDATGSPFLVMELLHGRDLSVRIQRSRVPPDEALEILRQTSRALDKTHAQSIVHRDLKPENLFLCDEEDHSTLVKILDFGIAKVVTQLGAKSTGSLGTPLYMAPEQIEGRDRIGPATDLYGLAHIAFAMLVGYAYWEVEAEQVESVIALVVQITKGPSCAASERAAHWGVKLGPRFDAWFERAAHADPTRRFNSARDLVDTLEEVLREEPPQFDAPPEIRQPPKRFDSVAATVAAASSPSRETAITEAVPSIRKGNHTEGSLSLDSKTSPRSRRVVWMVIGSVAALLSGTAIWLLASRMGETANSNTHTQTGIANNSVLDTSVATGESRPTEPPRPPPAVQPLVTAAAAAMTATASTASESAASVTTTARPSASVAVKTAGPVAPTHSADIPSKPSAAKPAGDPCVSDPLRCR